MAIGLRDALFGAALALFVATAPALGQETVSFTKVGKKVGDRYTETSSSTDVVVLKAGGADVRMDLERRGSMRIEVLAVEAARPARIKVAYGNVQQTRVWEGMSQTTRPPHANRTYIVERIGGGALSIQSEDGSAPRPEELEAVRSDHSRLGTKGAYDRLIPDAIRVGDPVELPLSDAQALFGDDETKVEGFTFRLAALEDGIARFTMQLTTRADGGPSSVKLELAGDVRVRPKDGRILSITLRGPATIRAKAGAEGLSLEGHGTTVRTTTYVYE